MFEKCINYERGDDKCVNCANYSRDYCLHPRKAPYKVSPDDICEDYKSLKVIDNE